MGFTFKVVDYEYVYFSSHTRNAIVYLRLCKFFFTWNLSGVLIYVFFEFAVFAFEIPSTKCFVVILFSNRFARFACQINISNQENMRAQYIWKLYDEQKIRTTKLRRMLNNSFFLFIALQRCVHLYEKKYMIHIIKCWSTKKTPHSTYIL